MSKGKSKLLLVIGILLVLLGGYAFFLDPIIGAIGFFCGIWTIFISIKHLRGNSLFNKPNDR